MGDCTTSGACWRILGERERGEMVRIIIRQRLRRLRRRGGGGRREDMEIYMFRLLLEWGRMVDDRRSELGFVMPPASFET